MTDTTPSIFVFSGNCILSLSCVAVMLKQVRLSLRKINHVNLAVVSHVIMHMKKKREAEVSLMHGVAYAMQHS